MVQRKKKADPIAALVLGAALLLTGATGCGGAAMEASDPPLNLGKAPPFPSRGQLSDIAKKQRPAQVFKADSVEVGGWKLVELPDAIDGTAITPANPWEKALVDVAAAQKNLVMPTQAMKCVARSSALFVLDHEAFPSRPARRFIASRCGSPLGDYSIFTRGWKKVPKSDTEEAIFARGEADLRKALGELLREGTLNAGIGYVRKDDRVLVVGVAQDRTATLESTPLMADEQHKWRLKGRLLQPARSIDALVNRGAYGVAKCDVDKSVALPDFSVTCELDPEDASAWADIIAFAPDRLLGQVVVETKIHAQGAPNDAYVQPSLPEDVKSPGGDMNAAIAAMVNAMRAKAGYGPLALEGKESQIATDMAPHYFASWDGNGDPAIADTVALGMVAGWDVSGDVRRGDFVSMASYGSEDARALVAEALRQPMSRRSLLSPKAERVAIGAATQKNMVGVIFGTYEMVKHAAQPARVLSVVKRLTELRAAIGLPPPVVLHALDAEAARIADGIEKGGQPGRGMQALLQRTTDMFAQSSRGFAVLTSSIDDLKMPDEIVRRRDLQIVVAVADYRISGSAWTNDLVIVAFLEADSQAQSASADGTGAARCF